jgi:transaldolase / glucose-6-phosphate isomerase
VNPLRTLATLGQSVWLDYIRRNFVTGGELANLVAQDGLAGVTSNPAIFEKAIAGSNDYAAELETLATGGDVDAASAYERLAVADLRSAADVLRPVWETTGGRDGYACLEVSPRLAHDSAATTSEARRLWKELDRPNVMVKVPATAAGLPAIEQLVSEGINVNVTLLFAVPVYARVVEAYLRGLERLAAGGGDLARVASVASFFVSRIDTEVDGQVERLLAGAAPDGEGRVLKGLLGRVAVANAKVAYQRYRELFSGPRWQALAGRGARTQRLLWASTSTKNPRYSDVLYVEELIGADTVNTMPRSTLSAFREHGKARASLSEDPEEARGVLADLEAAGISLEEVTDRLTERGVTLFAEAFDKLLAAVEKALAEGRNRRPRTHGATLPAADGAAVEETRAAWQEAGKTGRLWARDPTLWTGDGEAGWLGWLGITEDQRANLGRLRAVAEETRAGGYTHAVLLGMGGSSLAPEVLGRTFGAVRGFPALSVLDSTDPEQIRAATAAVDLKHTLFIVSSKSGSTLEPNLLMAHFLARLRAVAGTGEAARRFLVVTDPGSPLERTAEELGVRHVFHGVPTIGGRYSALSDFGMVPAAVAGLDTTQLLESADEMVHACASCVADSDNPGVALGVSLGALALRGRDKVTLVASPAVASLAAWLEQLLAESTGKHGKGLIPVAGEKLGEPEVYGEDRIFVYLRLESAPDGEQDAAIDRLAAAGQPVLRIAVAQPHDIAGEFFRWEMATAVAGSLLGINPFDQPDVEAAKQAARRLTAAYEAGGRLPAETPIAEDDGLAFYADPENAAALDNPASGRRSPSVLLQAHLARLARGDYFAVLAYLARNEKHLEPLQAIRHRVRDARAVATCLGFGPRFQHSTGQAYKGGPNTGVFLQITHDHADDLEVPGKRYTFGVVEAAQARGDLETLAARGRRALRVHLRTDLATGLARLDTLVAQALS